MAINLQVFPIGWFEQNANVIADPVQTTVIYHTLKTLRIMSVLQLFTRIGINCTFCFRLWELNDMIQSHKVQQSSMYPKQNHPAAAAFVIIAIMLVVFVEESLRTSTSACSKHPECAVNAHRWTIVDNDSLMQCPCLMLIDRDIAPKTYAEWLNPKNVTEKVAQLAATGDLQTLQLTNRHLSALPDELRRCRNLRYL
ncbi:unnamed protein product [Phytophthora lilii]|uniref:Unnamed protein product n=1 Tax=Phytophthora lilii TaxID=2077276 RepID=A0A9W6TNZ4_9STRA|nr:unnamed protein product [Phytophthora lilii]